MGRSKVVSCCAPSSFVGADLGGTPDEVQLLGGNATI